MADIKSFEPEKLIVAILYADETYLEKALWLLTEAFGPVDLTSEDYAFSDGFSSYYDAELGGKATRRIVSFKNCVDPSLLASIKLGTNAMEEELSTDEKRRVNLDPGLISHGHVLLASTKNAGHRFALSGGIYGELTLFYAGGRWNPFPWTYQDFKSEDVGKFLADVRNVYLKDRKLWLV